MQHNDSTKSGHCQLLPLHKNKPEPQQRCGCCQRDTPVAEIGVWVGQGPRLDGVCGHCSPIYFSVRRDYPDHNFEQALALARLLHLQQNLPADLHPKLQRLLILLQSKSKRGHRLLRMANQQGLSLQQLLALI